MYPTMNYQGFSCLCCRAVFTFPDPHFHWYPQQARLPLGLNKAEPFFLVHGIVSVTLLLSCCAEVGTSDRAAPVGTSGGAASVGVIVGGAVGGAVVLSGLILLALFKTGRIKTQKRDRSSSPTRATSGSASYPTLPQYPTIPEDRATSTAQYPTIP